MYQGLSARSLAPAPRITAHGAPGPGRHGPGSGRRTLSCRHAARRSGLVRSDGPRALSDGPSQPWSPMLGVHGSRVMRRTRDAPHSVDILSRRRRSVPQRGRRPPARAQGPGSCKAQGPASLPRHGAGGESALRDAGHGRNARRVSHEQGAERRPGGRAERSLVGD